jgi:Xaa-Pro aminopeptidase
MSSKASNRIQKLRQALAAKEIEAILISQPENRYYLSGFAGSAGFLLITPRNAVLATDSRYTEQARGEAPDYEIFRTIGDIARWLPDVTAGLNLRQLGFEAADITLASYRQMSQAVKKAGLKLVPTEGLVEQIRAVKEPEEIESITRAIEMTDAATEYIGDIIHTGISEKELAWEIEKFLKERGSDGLPFDIIVASGNNSALPHARPSSRTIHPGEPVVIDIGARFESYGSDLSRTICTGTPDDTFNRVYNTVLGAQLAAIAMIQEGMTGEEADRLARTVIEEAGYGEAFGHSLGHGLGLAPHEAPRLGPGSAETLTSGMVFTIEPGVYLAGWGGVRIEDTVVMEEGKIRVLSQARK